jgi:hypothetical protein
MGKPFGKEIEKIYDTYRWAVKQNTETIQSTLLNDQTPVLVVGSGGSLSACHFAVCLFQQRGIVAKAVTPLELYYSLNTVNSARVVFISASGKNSDILFAFKKSIEREPRLIATICMARNTPLTNLAAKYSIASSFEFPIPSGKDGFLATNSLIGYFGLLRKSLDLNFTDANSVEDDQLDNRIREFLQRVSLDGTLTVLYGGWGQPIAFDIESKFTEAALGNVHISDYRNFAHGRHHWFAKKGNTSAIVALVSPAEKLIAQKTLNLLPPEIPKLVIETSHASSYASVDLLSKSFELVKQFGLRVNIDPGRPGVPDFGRKLYNLRYSTLYEKKKTQLEST